MTDPIILEYELSPEDYADWMSFHSARSAFHRGHRRKALLLVPALWLTLTVLGGLSISGLVTWSLFTAVWMAVLPPYLRWYTRRSVRRLAEQGLTRGSVGPHRLVVDERGIIETTPFSETRVLWDGIDNVVEGERQVLIYLGPHAAVIVPKHAFPSALAVGAFVEGMNDLRERAHIGSLAGWAER